MFSCSHLGERSKVNELLLKFDENVRNGALHYWRCLVIAWEGGGVPVDCMAVKLLVSCTFLIIKTTSNLLICLLFTQFVSIPFLPCADAVNSTEHHHVWGVQESVVHVQATSWAHPSQWRCMYHYKINQFSLWLLYVCEGGKKKKKKKRLQNSVWCKNQQGAIKNIRRSCIAQSFSKQKEYYIKLQILYIHTMKNINRIEPLILLNSVWFQLWVLMYSTFVCAMLKLLRREERLHRAWI